MEICCNERFRDKSPRQIIPLLADDGVYVASESTFYRILNNEELNAHRLRSKPPQHSKPKELIANEPNQVWSWDITFLKSCVRGEFFYLYLVMDIFSRKVVAWKVKDAQCIKASSKLIESACSVEGISKDQLFIHSDNGGPMKGATMLATLRKLGVLPSFSRPSVSNDNAFSESLFKTLKYSVRYPAKPFESVSEASQWIAGFVDWYNFEHLHSALRFVTPDCRHKGQDLLVLEQRKRVYESARESNPLRWSKAIRSWDVIDSVSLNPSSQKTG